MIKGGRSIAHVRSEFLEIVFGKNLSNFLIVFPGFN